MVQLEGELCYLEKKQIKRLKNVDFIDLFD